MDRQPARRERASGDRVGAVAARLDRAEFAARLRDGFGPLWSIAAAVLNDRSQADDVVQEASMIALQKLEDFDAATSFTAWMGQIVRNVARNHARRRARSPVAVSDPSTLDRPGPRSRQGEGALSDERLRTAMEELSDAARACLVLRTVHGMAYRDIAAALDLPEGTAMSHVHRARAQLRERLANHSGGVPRQGATP